MDRKPIQNQQILKLQERSAASRSAIRAEYARLRQRLDVPNRILGSLREKPSRWVLGSTAVGLATGFLFPKFRSPKQTATKPPATRRALGLVWSVAQPFIKTWLANQLRNWLTHRIQQSHNHQR